MLGLRFCARALSSCGERGPLFIAVRGPLTIVASLVAEHRLQTRRLSSCGARAQSLRGTWDLPRPGLEPVFPALAGRFSTTAPPGKPSTVSFYRREEAMSEEELAVLSLRNTCALFLRLGVTSVDKTKPSPHRGRQTLNTLGSLCSVRW